jgi:chaperonin GroEL (HSP60 family)
VLVAAGDVEGEALATLVVNRLRGTVASVAVKAPGVGERRRAVLEDLALLTGANLIAEDLGRTADQLADEDFGRARRVRVDHASTTLIEGGGRPEAVRIRIAALEEPASQIIANAGLDAPPVIARLRDAGFAAGFNARTLQIEDLREAGIVDPAKVVRCALQHAASVATLVVTTEAVVVETDDDDEAEPGAG